MDRIAKLTPFLSVAPQITAEDIGTLAANGFRAVVNNRPDGEADDQPPADEIKAAAERAGLEYRYLPVVSGQVTEADADAFARTLADLKGPVLAHCRSGTRSATLWALSEAHHLHPDAILRATDEAGYDLSGLRPRLQARWAATLPAASDQPTPPVHHAAFDVLIVGGGAAGIAVAAGMMRRRPELAIAIIEPREQHYYQPGWTLVGAGAFNRGDTERAMAKYIPRGVKWIRAAAAAFEPDQNRVVLEDGERIPYRTLVVAPGIKLDWDKVEGLRETLGKNGVTSNYRFDLSSYTWDLVRHMRGGIALFTQPPMPIKCAGAPQKAMYLSCDQWQRTGALSDMTVEFNLAGGVLFGVKEFVPPLMEYVRKYGCGLEFNSNLKAVDGPARKAWFEVTDPEGNVSVVEKAFDMLHAVPPQTAPDFVRNSPLANEAGWVDVSPETLRHTRYGNIFGLGDAASPPNAKTAAAVRKQAPVVCTNLLATLDGAGPRALYEGYGSCPLTVERGRVIMAEFGYGGQLQPTFPFDPTVPRWSMWIAKTKILPHLYWDLMLRGHEWLAGPKMLPHDPAAHAVQDALPDKANVRPN